MSESNNVKFVENDGKWLWKRYDADGSVIYRSPLFNTEREAREDYEINGGNEAPSEVAPQTEPEQQTAPEEQSPEAPAEGSVESSVGTATGEEHQPAEDNSAGTATL